MVLYQSSQSKTQRAVRSVLPALPGVPAFPRRGPWQAWTPGSAGRTSLRRLMGHWLDRLGLNAGFESGFKSGGWGCMRVWSGTTGRADCPSAVVGFPSTRGIRCARRPDRQGLDVRHGVLGRAAKTVWTRSSDGGGNTESGKSWRSGGSDASFGCEPATGRL